MLNETQLKNYRLLRSLEGGVLFNPREARELSGSKQESLDALARNEPVFDPLYLGIVKSYGPEVLKAYFNVYKKGNSYGTQLFDAEEEVYHYEEEAWKIFEQRIDWDNEKDSEFERLKADIKERRHLLAYSNAKRLADAERYKKI